jgi:hypothetical protein
MEPVFPGMDPYLERPSLWPDVHNSLIYAVREQLQKQLIPRYKAIITPYISLESLEIGTSHRGVVPDIGIVDQNERASLTGTTAIAPAPLTMTAFMDIPTRLARLEIRVIDNETLVTVIEVLSPANKRPGAEGTDAYEKKRQELFQTTVNLLEIDLLRNGQRPRLTKPLPLFPYFILLSRARNRPSIDVWPLALEQPIPLVPVPLQDPDPDIPLDLTLALHQIYRSARYDLQIDYRADPPPPDLSPAESTWLDAWLRERGKR